MSPERDMLQEAVSSEEMKSDLEWDNSTRHNMNCMPDPQNARTLGLAR